MLEWVQRLELLLLLGLLEGVKPAGLLLSAGLLKELLLGLLLELLLELLLKLLLLLLDCC